jgi:hypothetical protein
MNRALVTMIAAALHATAFTPAAWADVTDNGAAAPGETASSPVRFDTGIDPGETVARPESGDPIADACRQFGVALNVAAANYEDFAYATAGTGNAVDYQDPTVWRTNVVGRTALREAAHAALSASGTTGLPPEVADPMRAWSLRATKLLVVMGLHGGGDSLNSNAAELNSDAHDAQMACATHVGRG